MYITSHTETYEDGDIIFREGDNGDWIYVIESGAVELSKRVAAKKNVIIDVLDPDDVFGELGFITKSPRTATARAIGRTRLGVLDREFLDDEFNKLSQNFQTMLTSLAMRLEKTTLIASMSVIRRKDDRIPKNLSLTFQSSDKLIKAYTENISLGGIFIKTRRPFSVGERFTLHLQLPDGLEPMRIECEVAWNRIEHVSNEKYPTGMGVKFIHINKTDRRRLKMMLEDVNPAPLNDK